MRGLVNVFILMMIVFLGNAGSVEGVVIAPQQPELHPTAVSWSPEANISNGQQVSITATITNTGADASGSILVDFQIDGTSIGTMIIDATESAFSGMETRDVSIDWIAETGQHTLSVVVDSAGAVEETDETNNSLSMILPEVTESPMVDLSVNSVNAPSDTTFKIGEETILTAVVQNNGEQSLALTFTVEFFVDGTSIGSETIGAYEPELGTGETVSVVHSWTPVHGGDHTISVTVDSGNDVAETDETNNSLDATLHVEAVDLVVAAISWEPAADLEDGQDVTFTARIRNDGSDALTVNSCAVNFAIDGASLGNAWLAETVLASGGTVDVAFTGTVRTGDQTVTVNVDSSLVISETNEDNNSLSADLPEIVDNTPPEEITNLSVSASEKASLSFTWTPSVNSRGDLAGYKAYFNGASEPELLPAAQTSLQKTGLAAGTAYTLQISAYDNSGNESESVSITGYTALENPIGLTASPRPAFVDLSWEPSSPEAMVDHYAVYVSTNDFLTVEGAATETTTGTSVTIGGLDSERTYHFAVVAVNLSGGMDRDVITIEASPLPGTAVSGNITTNTTWTVENSPYVVTGNVTVRDSGSNGNTATLTIEPGVEVRFESGTGLYIGYRYYSRCYHGALSAQGTSVEPILFTSNADVPAPGDWRGIVFQDDTTDELTLLKHCIVEYGGHTNDSNIYCADASPTIQNCTIQHSSANGIYLTGSSNPMIGGEDSGNIISNNGTYGIYSDVSSPFPTITHNTLSDNGSYAMRLRPRMSDVSDNTGTGNGTNGIEVLGEGILSDTKWQLNDLPYVVTGNVTVRDSGSNGNTATLTIEPGVEVRFESGTGLYIGYRYYSQCYHGALSAQGTSVEPILFTSNADVPAPGDWRGIVFQDDTTDELTLLEHCIVEYGGHTNDSNIYCADASPTIQNCTIQHSSANGIYLTGSSNPMIGGEDSGNIISNNGTYGIYSDVSSPFPTITHNTLSDNGSYAMRLRPRMSDVGDNTGTGNGTNGIEVLGEGILSDTKWQLNDLPYMVTGDVTVRYSSSNSSTATLTIEPGVEVRFESGTGLYIGYRYYSQCYHGALSAQGTSVEPILFTSNADVPAPGDWRGIVFQDDTTDELTLLEHCIVEYGGHTNDSNIYCADASPTIQNCTIQHSSANGIYLTGSSNPMIGGEDSGNIISNNGTYGIYSDVSSPFPTITHNTLSDNGSYAMRLRPRMSDVSDNTGTGNGTNGIEVLGEGILSDTKWQLNDLPYVVTGDVTVRYSSSNSSTATLTIEPGVEVRFESGTGLYIGYRYYSQCYHGALSAQGTSVEPILFTSNADVPAPGDWRGIVFQDDTTDELTLLEHCIVEYGGHTNNADIYINNARPTIQYNTIRNSSHSGVYVTGDGSDAVPISCNNLKDNHYGIYAAGNAQPSVSGNNFLRNHTFGLYNAHAQTVTANDNWWNDPNGPNTNGDATFGVVTTDTWLTAVSTCIATPPTNSPPLTPRNPSPADGAVRVAILEEGQPVAVTLSWAGGDPNPWDTVVYDLYFGTSADTLALVAESLDSATYAVSGLTGGTTYYWQVVARDDAGAETSGPVWSFTTIGDPPDLQVSQLTWNPTTDLVAGQSITLVATITNAGSGPVVDAFKVAFAIDGTSVGTVTVNPVIAAAATRQVSITWTTTKGSHTLTVTADSADAVEESYEENNTLSASLPEVIDTTPPTLVVSTPSNGAILQEVSSLSMTLADAHGSIADAAVIASVTLVNGSGQAMTGSTVESGDVFTFTPAASPLPDDTYTFSLDGVDDSGNTAHFSIAFTVDGQVPAAPTLTGGEILSGTLSVQPAENRSNIATITVTGTREDATAIYINGSQKVALGSGDWSTTMSLSQDDNALEIWAHDAAGNVSESIFADVSVDSVAPTITGAFPTADSFLSAAPAVVSVSYTETGSGLNTEACTRSLQDADGNTIAGTWDFTADGTVSFTPAAALADGGYALSVQLEDNYTNSSSALNRAFTVDTVAPEAPVIDAVTTPTHNPSQTITGTKEAYAAISMNGTQVVANTEATTWQTTVTLASGENTFAFVATDRAGNASETASTVIVFDDIAPDPVTTLTVNGQGSGTTAILNWSGYDEAAHGDVASYRIYWQEGTSFTVVTTDMPVHDTIPAGTFTATATSLIKGTTVWFAVVAVDKMGNFNSAVTPVSALLEDIQAPENVTNLAVSAQADSLTFTWTASANSAGDLAGYRIYLDGGTEYTALAADQLTHTFSGLGTAEAHTLKITAVDDAAEPNESSGASLSGVTWLPNPSGLSGEPFSGYVQLAWNAAQPSAHVKSYRVYTSDAAFGNIDNRSGSHAVVTATGTSAKVAGLTNGQTYWFAVTTVNTSDGEDPAVVAVSATPEADAEGPEISDLMAGNQAFADGYTLTGTVTLSLSASDPSGVSRVEFSLDGTLLRTDYSAPYTCYLDPADMADGSHTLIITAYDTLDNRTTLTINFTVALALPDAPVISSPTDGTTTNKTQVVVSGQALADTTVKLYVNGLSGGASGTADGKGYFSIILTLAEGANSIQASAANRSGEGPLSIAVTVTLDTTLPSAPTAVTATAKSGGVIRIGWQKPSDSVISGYNLYRSAAGFTDVAQAQRVNASTLTSDSFEDVPGSDGTWYYRVTCLDAAGNESEPSSQVFAVADSIAPRAVSIVYTPEGAHDTDTGTMAPGTVNLVLTVSEALQATPFLSITPSGATPISVDLTQIDDTTYGGFFVIADTTPSGNAWAVFSGRDMVGNRGTEIDAGGTILIDTDGPSVHRLVVTPQSPIQNDVEEPVTVTAVLGLSEAVKAGTLPEVGYLLSGDGRETVTVDSLAQLATADGDAQTWQAVFSLPADAGAADAESLSLTFSAFDDLDNAGSDIDADNRFQVYQGDLPPLEAPDGLTGRALPGGKVQLSWNPVDQAVAYQVYRQGPDETELAVLTRLDDGSLIEHVDATETDGDYTYAVTSIRAENGQEAESGLSDTVTVAADSVAPNAPTDFALELVANGIKASWNPPAYTEAITYSLYRAPQTEITTVDGLDALAEGIEATLVVDPHPSDDDHCYTVTAVDAAGNQSPPATSSYLNFDLLPVSSLSVVQSESESPVVSWTHSGSTIAGYRIYLGDVDAGVQLSDGLLTDTQYTDIGWSDDQRQYTVVAVDADDVASLGRGITLPVIEASLVDDAVVRRGLMNRLTYTVKNRSDSAASDIRLQAVLGGRTHQSEAFSLAADATASVDVVVGGYADLTDPADLPTTIVITPETNETVRIVRSGQVRVSDGMLVLQIANESFTRGGTGKVWFTLENTGDEEIEIVTARNSGNSDSDQIAFTLLDEDENVITAKAFRQAVGDGVVTLADKRGVARIGAGEAFTAAATIIDVPSTAPDDVTVRLSIGNVYYHLGRDTQVSMTGLATTHAVNLEETAYVGQLDGIDPQTSTGDTDITITGKAVECASGDPLGGVPLNLIVTNAGFESKFPVYTGSDGSFSHAYTPATGASGIFTVRVMHPDLTDKPVHGQFVISRVSLSPTTASLNIPYNYTQAVTIKAATGEGTAVTNLRLEYLADDQSGGVLATGIHVTPGATVTALAGGGTANLPFSLWADNTAATTASLVLRVASDENARWGLITVNTAFSEAKPVLKFSPDHIETGMAIDGSVTETLTLSNKGLAAMTDVSLALLSADGSAAPAWAVLNGSGDVGDLAVGDEYEASVTFSPGEDVAEGVYSLILRVTGSNYAQTDIHIYASVTQSGVGSAAFKISDIYTGTLNDSLQVIQGLSGAKVVLENEAVSTESYTRTSDTAGEAFFEDLPAGRYKARITAANHQEYTGRVWIKPGITTTTDVFLEYNLVTVEWSVTETTIQDSYDIVLTATYETSVPAAVVGISPASITLPAMQAGDVYNGEITLTNYGLIRADAVTFSLPADDAHFSYEFSGNLPDTIGAKQQVTIPYRVTCISPLEPDSDGSGGGCGTYIKCMDVNYGFECANGVWTHSSARHCWTRAWGSCSSGGTSGSSGGSVVISAGSAGGTASGSYTPSATTVSGAKCFPKPERKESFCFPCMVKSTLKHFFQIVFSRVNLWMREYNRDHVDLAVKVPGGQVEVKRWYYGDAWHFEHLRHHLAFTQHSIGTGIESIDKGGVTYAAATSESKLFVHEIYHIAPTQTGYRWYDPDGNWKTFDTEGRMTAWGDRVGTIGSLLYEGDLVTGVLDRTGSQVIWFTHDGSGNISSASDGTGRGVGYAYTDGLLTTVTDAESHDTDYAYDSSNRINRTVDAENHGSNVTYDSYGNVASVKDDDGEGWSFEYDYDDSRKESYVSCTSTSGMVKETWFNEDGEAIRVDVNGRTVMSIAKDGNDELVTGENGKVTRKDYDTWDNQTQVTYPDGSTVVTAYNLTFNKPSQRTDENKAITRFAYDTVGNLVRKVEAAGTDNERVTEYTYDGDGNLLSVTRLADGNTAESQTVMTYDEQGNLTSVTDPENGVTRFTRHDIMGNVLEKIDARGKTWTYTYDSLGRLLTVTDPLLHTTEHRYDNLGRRIYTRDAENRETTYEYDNHGNLLRAVDHENNSTWFEYNSDNKLVKQTDAEGHVVLYDYDNEGRLTRSTDGHGDAIAVEYDDTTGSGCATCSGATGSLPSRTIYPTFERTYTYDLRGRKTAEQDHPDAVLSTTFAYDDAGNLISRTDRENRTTYYAYDGLNRLTKVIDPATGETKYAYDGRDNLVALTDAENQTTRFDYDAANRLVKETRPRGGETHYNYDAAGNLSEKIDAKDQKAAYEYDDAGRLTAIRYYAVSTDTVPVKTVTFTYDNVGNLTGYDDGTTSAVYAYDSLHRKTAETVNYGAFSLENAYTYYKNGLKKTYQGPDAIVYGYLFDANNQLAAVQIPNAGYATVSDYHWNRPAAMLLPGGGTKEFDYDPLMRVKQITDKDPAANPVLNYAFTYDRMDNVTAKATEHGDYTYGYDNLYRLTDVDNPDQADEAFTYDAVGNRLTAADTSTEWGYNENNELTGYDDVTYDYDLNGNMIAKTAGGVVTRFFYNLEDRLERVEDGSGNVIASYYYDPFGRRLWKDVAGTRTCFHYSDEGLVGEYDATGSVIKTYGWKPGSTWSTDPLFMKIGGTYYYYHSDHIGTPQKLTTASGAVVWSTSHSSFGETSIAVETAKNNLRLPGQYQDSETSLHYNWHRYYDPTTGRYLTPDPIGLNGGINPFVYTENNPVNFIDPEGLKVWRCARKLGDKNGPQVKPSGSPLRHDYLQINNDIRSFQAGSNIIWSQGWVDFTEKTSNPKCQLICADNNFDKYVLDAAKYAPKYSVIPNKGSLPYMLGARNCQSWADDVLKNAIEKFIKENPCQTCFSEYSWDKNGDAIRNWDNNGKLTNDIFYK